MYRLDDYCGGSIGDWSVDASDKNNIGIAEAALQMLSLNDDDEGKASTLLCIEQCGVDC